MDLTITLICEYIFIKRECCTYLRAIDIDVKQYKHIYTKYVISEETTEQWLGFDSIYCNEHIAQNEKKLRKIMIYALYCNAMLNLSGCQNLILLICRNIDNYNVCHELRLPSNLIFLTIDYCNGLFINKLPNTLRHFEGYNYELPKLPDNLRYLKVGRYFNHGITSLPEKLTHLILGQLVNNKLCQIPDLLEYLEINSYYNIKLTLPKYLDCLSWNHDYYPPKLPVGLIKLIWNCNIELPILSSSVTHLTLGYRFEQCVTLPHTITHLRYECAQNNCQILPIYLEYLIWNSYNKIPPLSQTLTHLIIYKNNTIPNISHKLKYLRMDTIRYSDESLSNVEILKISTHNPCLTELQMLYGDKVRTYDICDYGPEYSSDCD
jgi:hypothetical protein